MVLEDTGQPGAVQRDLGDGLLLRCASEADIGSILEHIGSVHGADVVPTVRRMIGHFPDFSLNDSFIVVDTEKRLVVAHLCLLRKRCVLEGIEFPFGQMEYVGTHPDYRGRGLVRQLNRAFEGRVAEHRLPFVVIAGIPYFYRQFGYEYALPLGLGGGRGQLVIPTEVVPSLTSGEQEPVTVEKVRQSRFEAYLECRSQRNRYLDLYRSLGRGDWDYLAGGTLGEAGAIEMYLLERDGKAAGAFSLSSGWGRLQVCELWLDDVNVLFSVLRFAGKLAQARGQPLAFEPPSSPTLKSVLEGLTGSEFRRPYAWYVRIPSIRRFLETIKHVLEQRIAASEFHGLSDTFRLGWYRQGAAMVFDQGMVVRVEELHEAELTKSHVHMPPLVVNQLLLGYRTLDELIETYPDARVEPSKKRLAQVLFPKIRANLSPET